MLAGLSACSSTKGRTAPDDEPVTEAVDPQLRDAVELEAAKAQKAGEADEEIEDQLAPEDFEDGFCVDDIYATYLIKRYAAENLRSGTKLASNIKSKQRSRRRGIDMRKEDLEALHFARTRMAGPTMPYFGAFPVVVNEKVDFWIRYFKTAGRRDFMRWLVRGESIKKTVQPVLQAEGIPTDLFYLAMVESGFSNNAYSRARATGTWQFMKGTAQLYGLKINHWVDERRDPVKSTLAAAAYLRDLYMELGDWHLAMAAYNAGPGKIRKSIRRSGSDSFWKIADTTHLANETRNYVPKVLAAILLAANPRSHGFDVTANPVDEIPDQEIVLTRPVRLTELSSNLGISVAKLKQWNPELVNEITPPAKSGYTLRLTPQYAQLFPSIQDKLSVIEVKEVHMHVIRQGETLSRIAQRYKVGIKQIMSLNPSLKATRLRIGREIAIPIPGVVVSG